MCSLLISIYIFMSIKFISKLYDLHFIFKLFFTLFFICIDYPINLYLFIRFLYKFSFLYRFYLKDLILFINKLAHRILQKEAGCKMLYVSLL